MRLVIEHRTESPVSRIGPFVPASSVKVKRAKM